MALPPLFGLRRLPAKLPIHHGLHNLRIERGGAVMSLDFARQGLAA
jgi:hypothetical protein